MKLLTTVRVEIGESPFLPQSLVVGPGQGLGELEPRPLECARLLQRVGAHRVVGNGEQPVLHLAVGLGDDLGAHRRGQRYARGLTARGPSRPSVAVTRYNGDLMTVDGPPASGSVPQIQSPSLVGQILDGRYRLIGKLGEGGMGEVYAAEHIHIEKRFAIKLLRPEIVSNAEA